MDFYPNQNNHYEFDGIEQYETLISAIPGGIVITEANDDFTIIFANQGYYDMVGYERDEHFEKFKNVGINTLHPDEAGAAAKSAKDQMLQSSTFSVKAKLSHKTKEYIWVHFSGRLSQSADGNARIYIVIVDISEFMLLMEQLEREHRFNVMISTLSEDAFFDSDYLSRTIRFSKNFADRLGVDEVVYGYPEKFLEKVKVAPESAVFFKESVLHAPDDIVEDEIHFILPEEGDVWYLCHYQVIRNCHGKPVRAIGKLSDITKHKAQIEELSEMAQRDQLTGLYNKATTEDLIKEILKKHRSQYEEHALMIIDVDNFKSINDRLGHLYGDAVLTQLAESLKPIFRSDDIIGRIGGDEFFVLMKNYHSKIVIESKAREICSLFRRTYSERDALVTISASIGIALYPQHGKKLEELYRSADTALYNTKATGKNNYSFFDGKTVNVYESSRTEIDNLGGIQKNFKKNRIEYVFKLLHGYKDPRMAIKAVLQLIAEEFRFSRVNLLRFNQNRTYYSDFEWCADGIPSIEANYQNIPLENICHVVSALENSDGMLLKRVEDFPKQTHESYRERGIKHLVYFAITNNDNKLLGSIAFQDCVNDAITLTNIELDELRTICQVFATFILKQINFEVAVGNYKSLSTIIENMVGYAYVIDLETYEILYENNNVRNLTNFSNVGKCCHNSYMGFDLPCEVCFIKFLSEENPKHTLEIYNEKFNIYLRTTGSLIDWINGKKVCLVNSIDITEYKIKAEEKSN